MASKKSVSTRHPDYDKFSEVWKKNRDCTAGQNAIKGGNDYNYISEGNISIDNYVLGYLPPLSGHYNEAGAIDSRYITYLNYALWYGATGRTVDGYVGLVFRKSPIVEVPEKLKYVEEDFGLNNQSISSFTLEVLREIVTVDRVGILEDYPKASGDEKEITIEQKEQQNIRPYASIYKTESIINWREEIINNVMQTSMVVLKEVYDDYSENIFAGEKTERYRVLTLEPYFNEGIEKFRYRVTLYKDPGKNGNGEFEEIDNFYPMIKGEYIDHIPFYCITSKGLSWKLDYSVINDLCDVNISHYRNSANKENGLIWTGNPTPYVSGLLDRDDTTIRLGSTEAIELDVAGKAGYMEFTGQGLRPISDTMHEKEHMMATLGAKIIASEKKVGETAETAIIHRAGEQGVLGTIANNLSEVMTLIMRNMANFEKVSFTDETLFMKLNTDYVPVEMTANDMIGLMQMYQGGAISMNVLRWNLRKGERIPNIISDEIIDEQIKENPPPVDPLMNSDIEEVDDDQEIEDDNLDDEGGDE